MAKFIIGLVLVLALTLGVLYLYQNPEVLGKLFAKNGEATVPSLSAPSADRPGVDLNLGINFGVANQASIDEATAADIRARIGERVEQEAHLTADQEALLLGTLSDRILAGQTAAQVEAAIAELTLQIQQMQAHNNFLREQEKLRARRSGNTILIGVGVAFAVAIGFAALIHFPSRAATGVILRLVLPFMGKFGSRWVLSSPPINGFTGKKTWVLTGDSWDPGVAFGFSEDEFKQLGTPNPTTPMAIAAGRAGRAQVTFGSLLEMAKALRASKFDRTQEEALPANREDFTM